jgi:hypothetical protein
MNSFRTGYWHKRATIALMLLGLLFQVQIVFACQMMEYSGPINPCCCGEMATPEKTDNDHVETSGCCDISGELVFKAIDLEGEEPVALQSGSASELPPATLVFILASLWPQLVSTPPSESLRHLDADPGSPGTATYLSTLRLRI